MAPFSGSICSRDQNPLPQFSSTQPNWGDRSLIWNNKQPACRSKGRGVPISGANFRSPPTARFSASRILRSADSHLLNAGTGMRIDKLFHVLVLGGATLTGCDDGAGSLDESTSGGTKSDGAATGGAKSGYVTDGTVTGGTASRGSETGGEAAGGSTASGFALGGSVSGGDSPTGAVHTGIAAGNAVGGVAAGGTTGGPGQAAPGGATATTGGTALSGGSEITGGLGNAGRPTEALGGFGGELPAEVGGAAGEHHAGGPPDLVCPGDCGCPCCWVDPGCMNDEPCCGAWGGDCQQQ